MREKLPADFDADWYAATYPDVGLSGLRPADHYLLFGRVLGRKFKGSGVKTSKPAQLTTAEMPAASGKAALGQMSEPESSAGKDVAAAVVTEPAEAPTPKPKLDPIIDRPDDLDPSAGVASPPPRREGADEHGHFSLARLTKLPGQTGENRPAILAYARLFGIGWPEPCDNGQTAISCDSRLFQLGPSRIENAWVTGDGSLRLMVSGQPEPGSSDSVLIIRAYQAEPSSPAELRMVGEGVQLPAVGPVIHDLPLLNPYMPLLLELSDQDGLICFCLLPFPSLLPGGLHWAELKAAQTEPNPMDDFWASSQALLTEAIHRREDGERLFGSLHFEGIPLPETQPPFTAWLNSLFGVAVGATDEVAGAQLAVPQDCLPTLSALVARRTAAGESSAQSISYLVAEEGSHLPRWLITLPAALAANERIPSLQTSFSAVAGPDDGRSSRLPPLAIAFRSPAALPDSSHVGAERKPSSALGLTVVIKASDGERSRQLLQSVRSVITGELEVQVQCDDLTEDVRRSLAEAIALETAWVPLSVEADLREVAATARYETMLTISDRVQLGDGQVLLTVLDLLRGSDDVASASCALLSEKIIKRNIVLEPACGGLFPTAVAFSAGPHLTFGEPDVFQALPNLTYPVVANSLFMTAWRSNALAALPAGPSTRGFDDIRIGLDLMRAGYRNLCTTKIAARLSGQYRRRDAIDPVGPGYLHYEQWEEILGRVTLVRELF
jgi:hypothetical protein